jgi:hypothetical protein
MLIELDAQLDARQLKELQVDIKMTWAEVMGVVKDKAG